MNTFKTGVLLEVAIAVAMIVFASILVAVTGDWYCVPICGLVAIFVAFLGGRISTAEWPF